jgi:hypothetical protein
VKNHGLRWGYTWTKSYLQERGYLKKAPRRGAHRRKRVRKPLPGMMLHQDASRHCWVPGLSEELDLVVTLDDACVYRKSDSAILMMKTAKYRP